MKRTTVKTTVELEVEKVELAKRLGKAPTLKQLLDQALDAYIAQARRRSMADLLGTRFFAEAIHKKRGNRGRAGR